MFPGPLKPPCEYIAASAPGCGYTDVFSCSVFFWPLSFLSLSPSHGDGLDVGEVLHKREPLAVVVLWLSSFSPE